jgi:hypothetical protein
MQKTANKAVAVPQLVSTGPDYSLTLPATWK